MADLLEELAKEFGLTPLSGPEVNRLLGAARDVAHRTERKAAPLGSFLLGMEVQRRMDGGASREDALEAAITELMLILPDAEPDSGSDTS